MFTLNRRRRACVFQWTHTGLPDVPGSFCARVSGLTAPSTSRLSRALPRSRHTLVGILEGEARGAALVLASAFPAVWQYRSDRPESPHHSRCERGARRTCVSGGLAQG
jgi:hypothetical protein